MWYGSCQWNQSNTYEQEAVVSYLQTYVHAIVIYLSVLRLSKLFLYTYELSINKDTWCLLPLVKLHTMTSADSVDQCMQ